MEVPTTAPLTAVLGAGLLDLQALLVLRHRHAQLHLYGASRAAAHPSQAA